MPNTIGYPVEKIRRSKKSTDAVSRAKQLLAVAKDNRTVNREPAWGRSRNAYKGNQWGDFDDTADFDRDYVTVNMSFSTVNTITPYITGGNTVFVLQPRGGEATPKNARVIQSMLNSEWQSIRMDGNAHLGRSAEHALIEGDGFLKASYTITDKLVKGEATDESIAELWVDSLNPEDVWLDPTADGLHDARWAIVRITRSVSELKATTAYSNTGNLSAGLDRDDPSAEKRTATGNERDMLVSVFEFYDIVNKELVVFTDQGDLPLQFVEGITCPLAQMGNYSIPGSPYHMGELEQLRWLQDELNKTRTQMVEHRRRNAQKWGVRPEALGQGAKDALQSEDVNAVVELTDNTRTLQDQIMPLEVPQLSADAYNVDVIIKGDIYEISGINEYLRGSTPEIRRTATEATIIEGASNIKTAHKLRMVERSARRIGTLLLGIATDVFPLTDADEMSMILTGKEAQAVAQADDEIGDASAVTQVMITPDRGLFAGRYEVFVEQGSTELRNPVMREQKYREMLAMLVEQAPVVVQFGVNLNLQKAYELYFEAAGVDDINSMFQMAPPPQAMPQEPPPGGPGEPPQGLPPEMLAAMTGGGAGAPGAPPGPLGPDNTGALESISA